MAEHRGRLSGKVAVITGTGGIGTGRSAALRFAAEGACVVGCDVDVEGSKETLRLVREAGGTMVSLEPCDIGEDDAVERLMQLALSEYGGIDILYNNAAWIRPGSALNISADDLRYSLDGTIVATWRVTRAAVPHLRKRGGGSVINISSSTAQPVGTGALDNFNAFLGYAVGKAGVIRLTQLLAIDLAAMGIRVNCIAPGSILPQAQIMLGEEGSALRREWEKAYLVPRPGTGDDIAAAALFLASADAAYITGETIVVDGGLCISGMQGVPLQRGIYDDDMVAAASRGSGISYDRDE